MSSLRMWLPGLVAIALTASCYTAREIQLTDADASTGSPDGGYTATGASLPCDVESVLRERCLTCHSSPPAAGAPMPLVTWSDTQHPSHSDPTVPVWQMISRRIHNATTPMPPTGALPAAELATLDAWISATAPARDGGSCAGDDASAPPSDAGPVGPEALPCDVSTQQTFRAHAAGSPTTPFHVAQDAGNLYQCFTFASPFTSTTQATAFAPIIDDRRVVHHWILYQTATPQPDGAVGPCNMPSDARFLAGWAPGGGNNVMPTDVGENLPPAGGGWLILQLHYWNVAGYTDSNDRSGVAMCTTSTPRTHSATVLALGPLGIAVPPHATGYTVQGECTDRATQPLHIISAFPHMHTHGTAIGTEILRGGSATNVETLVDVSHWDFNGQQQFPLDTTINPGDILRTSCTYANPTDATIYFGENTENEMCFDFVTIWPAEALMYGSTAVTYCNN